MLMRNPDYQVEYAQEVSHHVGQSLDGHTSREMILGQIVLMLLFLIAILLQILC